jgi:hypothetical protein
MTPLPFRLHTFQGGCSSAFGGDLVDDTPYHMEPDIFLAITCDKHHDTCPDLPGHDPAHNFMNYGLDSCRTEFTPGQMYVILVPSTHGALLAN